MAPSVKSSPVYINTSVSHADSRTLGSNVLLPQELTNLSTILLKNQNLPTVRSQILAKKKNVRLQYGQPCTLFEFWVYVWIQIRLH
jgi:hypothetical protein